MKGIAPLSFAGAHKQVEGMMQDGAAFARVEDAIDTARLSQRHKGALWLLAWSLRDPVVQRREARLMLGEFPVDQRREARLMLGAFPADAPVLSLLRPARSGPASASA